MKIELLKIQQTFEKLCKLQQSLHPLHNLSMQVPVLGRALRTVYANMGRWWSTISHPVIFEDFRLPNFYPIEFTYTEMCMMWIHRDFMGRTL